MKSAVSVAGLGILLLASHSAFSQTTTDQVPVDSQPLPLPPIAAPASPLTPAPAPPTPAIPAAPNTPAPPPTPLAPMPVTGVVPDAQTQPALTPELTTPLIAAPMPTGDVRNAKTLNPILNPTDKEIRASIEVGRTFAKKDKDVLDVLDSYARGFSFKRGGILGEVRRPLGLAYALTPELEAQWDGFLEAREFATTATQDADFSTIRNRVANTNRTLSFIVQIMPEALGKESGGTSDAAAIKSALGSVRFVLSDDNDNNYDSVDPVETPRIVDRRVFFDAIAGSPDTVFSAATMDDLPLASTAPPGTVLIKPRLKESGLSAFYLVTFNLFNSDGTARVNRDTKFISLRVLMPTGPKYAAFDLMPTDLNAPR